MKGIRLKKAVLSDFRFAVQMSHNVETHVILEIPYPYVFVAEKDDFRFGSPANWFSLKRRGMLLRNP